MSVSLATVPSLAFLTVTSSVPGAKVYLDDKSAGAVGLTPFGWALRPGKHTVYVVADGYREEIREVDAVAGVTSTIDVVLAAAPMGYLTTRGDDAVGAQVYVDGKLTCDPGICRRALSPGPHEVRVTRAGHRPLHQRVTIAARSDTSLAIDLAPVPRRWDAVAAYALAAGFAGAGVALHLQDGRGYPIAAGASYGLSTLSLAAAIYLTVRERASSRGVVTVRSLAWHPVPSVNVGFAGVLLARGW